MTVKANGRSALILAAGLFVCFAGPSQAGPDNTAASSKSEDAAGAPVALDNNAKHASSHSKSGTHHKSGKVVLKSSDSKKADTGDNSLAIPPSVANANAQLAPDDTTAGKAKAMSTRASEILRTASDNPANAQQVVSADQLNELDRALHESMSPAPPTPTLALASAEVPAAAPPVTATSGESSTWDQTSLIGKIFIGFGTLLTMASAARMFMT
jgi:hypothetical protein